MLKTDSYRRQHNNIRLIISTIEEETQKVPITDHLETIADSVRKLFGQFATHLAIEDKVLYPKALNHENPLLSKTAKQFQNEMGNLGTTFDKYRKKWPGELAISKDPDSFLLETREIITLLKQRLEREESELYQIYDQVA